MQPPRPIQSLTPAYDQIEWQKKLDAINKCGKNFGPHDYIPIEWMEYPDLDNCVGFKDAKIKLVSKLMCRVCFVHVKIVTLMKMYGEVKI